MRTKNLQSRIKHRSRRRSTPGFTLVEMLVAVALVLLMMSLFAQVFQMAGSTITTQRGIAENDQRSRTVQNIIKGDLDKRTFRLVMPWATGEEGGLPDTSAVHREGYFYYSENDPANDLDDVLQFTINVNTRVKNPDTTALFGKATAGATWANSSGSILPYLRNQPEADDGWSTTNGTAEAPAAEVSYFVRGGKLYRRMLLIRATPWGANSETQPSYMYNNTTRYDLFDYSVPAPPSGPTPYPDPLLTSGISFWNDFDHSAFPQLCADNTYAGYNLNITMYARFHGVEDLSNTGTSTFPLGRPQFRFGHRLESSGSITGRPREFDSSGVYFGRFTHEETSDSNFHHPHGRATAISGTIDPTIGTLNLNTTTNVFPDFVGGLRRGEDLLLSNVHSFDVKIWDPAALGGAGAFVNIGQSVTPQDPNSPNAVNYAIGNRSNTVYGPVNTASAFAAPYDVNRVFDTWHPDCNIDIDGTSGDDPPPFRHVIYGAGTPNNNEWGRAVGQPPNLAVKQQPTWLANPSTPYAPGDLVFPTSTNRRQNGLRYVYRCVKVEGTPSTVRTEPLVNEWPGVAGARFQDGTATDYIVWEAVDNWKPLRAIQITIRFHDITSDQIRQQTIVHALAD